MYWKICIVGIFQVYKINFFFFKRTYTSAFESAGIGPFKLYWFKTYTSVFESVGIGTTYASVFESAGIGTTYASAFKSAGIGLPKVLV